MKKIKLHSFEILKISTSVLKNGNYNLKGFEPLPEQIVSMAENTFIEKAKKISGGQVDFDRMDEIDSEIKFISSKRNSNLNREKISRLLEERITLSFVDSVILLYVENKSQYTKIHELGGFEINGKHYVRFLAGAGHLRNDSVFFVWDKIYDELLDVLNCGRDVSQELNPGKLNAYFALSASSGNKVSFPNFIIIPDYFYKRSAHFDFIDDNNKIEKKEMTVEMNAFDGAGIISPRLGKIWASDLGIDYLPSTFLVRSAFIKGMSVVFDIHALAKELGKSTVKDIYGKEHNVFEVDLFISESQFKLSGGYRSGEDYIQKLLKYDFPFRVSRYSHRYSKRKTTTNYMFLQSLSNDLNVESLCGDTVSYFADISFDDIIKTVLYMSGESSFGYDFDTDDFSNLDIVSKALLSYPKLINETYIRDRISSSLERQRSEAKLGKLIIKGNYSFIVSDPYAQCEHILGLVPEGLLSPDENYSGFWNGEGVTKVLAARSPLTHNSEVMLHKLIMNYTTEKWYKYQNTSHIISFKGLESFKGADFDFDGDIIMTTDNDDMISAVVGGNPITYNHPKAEKKKITQKSLFLADMSSMGTKIGFITNISSSLHSLYYSFLKGSVERHEIGQRLKLLRMYQGFEIDSGKSSGEKRLVPDEWSKWSKELGDLDKRIIADRRPYFMVYLYPHYFRKYKKELDSADRYCWSRFGKSASDVLSFPSNRVEENFCRNYYKYSYFIFSPSPMNRVCWHMEETLSTQEAHLREGNFEYKEIYSSRKPNIDEDKLKAMYTVMEKYIVLKKVWRKSRGDIKKDIWDSLSQIRNNVIRDVTSNSQEIGDLAVALMEKTSRASSFSWNICGDDIVENILSRHGRQITIPLKDDYGDIKFLYEKYSTKRVYV